MRKYIFWCQIIHQMRYDEDLENRVEKLCFTLHAAENKTEPTGLYTSNPCFYDLMQEIQNIAYYHVLEDKQGSILLTSETEKYESLSPMFISFKDFQNTFVPNFLKMDSKFLIANREYIKDLCAHFPENGTNRIVVDVEFSDICNGRTDWEYLCYDIKNEKDVMAITSDFLKSSFIERFIIRLKKENCDFSIPFPMNVELYFDNCNINRKN
ncbi:putative LRR containing protein [Trachipleistophora hominis]|uniref:Putative LRR containing protein n=1 Tax=Trachipleistophora hominis TaxID=72359 RepID=L7JRT7_TRAHO|nr:putative LRR containing protein [Trachipleistophora hominis]